MLNFGKKIKFDTTEIKPVEWRREKILNPETNKMVFVDSALGKKIKSEERYIQNKMCREKGFDKYDTKLKKCVKVKADPDKVYSPKKRPEECPVGSIK